MKKTAIWITSVVLLALCWLALDDITTGSEPSFLMEWLMVAGTALWFGILAVRSLHDAKNSHSH